MLKYFQITRVFIARLHTFRGEILSFRLQSELWNSDYPLCWFVSALDQCQFFNCLRMSVIEKHGGARPIDRKSCTCDVSTSTSVDICLPPYTEDGSHSVIGLDYCTSVDGVESDYVFSVLVQFLGLYTSLTLLMSYHGFFFGEVASDRVALLQVLDYDIMGFCVCICLFIAKRILCR